MSVTRSLSLPAVLGVSMLACTSGASSTTIGAEVALEFGAETFDLSSHLPFEVWEVTPASDQACATSTHVFYAADAAWVDLLMPGEPAAGISTDDPSPRHAFVGWGDIPGSTPLYAWGGDVVLEALGEVDVVVAFSGTVACEGDSYWDQMCDGSTPTSGRLVVRRHRVPDVVNSTIGIGDAGQLCVPAEE